ncbi:hypothetical protein T4D_15050 [Trichinella pseudospiralis]|uniref:Uncharacterized protein n=1 Tax=Trichinella pseudospiralis TaxID=6337 RepID=A0A0V1FV69_TRIPS|nr:hypothetical protein T4D_15050 [Trichinella pseudospiralis]
MLSIYNACRNLRWFIAVQCNFVWIEKLAKFPNAHFILSYKEPNNMKYRFKGRNKMTSVGTLVNQ